MDKNVATSEKAIWCLVIAGAVGLVAAILLWFAAGWGFLQGAFGAIVVAAVTFAILYLVSASSLPAPVQAAPAEPKAAPAEPEVATAKPAAPAQAEASAFKMQTTAALPGEAELGERKGAWKYEGDAPEAKPVAKKPAAKKPAAKKTTAKKAAAKKPAAKAPAKAAAKKAPAKTAKKPVAADGQPELLSKARDGGADNLKLISGVGPKLEQTLNEMGIWHFDQVAGLRKKEIAWVDDRLKFKGRIERDDWMSQAKVLAKGGETEFSKKKSKG